MEEGEIRRRRSGRGIEREKKDEGEWDGEVEGGREGRRGLSISSEVTNQTNYDMRVNNIILRLKENMKNKNSIRHIKFQFL